MSKQEAPRCTVQGVQVLLLQNDPYIEVAERVRLVHKAGKSFSFKRGDVLRIHDRWIYRVYITVDGQQYIGDAEIHFGAPANTPNGTNPITCGQTSAIGNALAFAGFGNLKSVLAQLGLNQDSEIERPLDSSRFVIQDIEVVMLNEEPYVDVAERIYSVHRTGKTFSMQQCKLIQYNTVWIYRASIAIDGQQYIGDAEIYFDALHEPDRTYPISCGQTSAVGNALAFAGFGDVRSILERCGKEVPDTLEGKPLLSSANAISRALQHASMVDQQDAYQRESRNRDANQIRRTGAGKGHGRKSAPMTPGQRDRIQILCEQLGESEPAYATMTDEDADVLLVQLERSKEELLVVAHDRGKQEYAENTQLPQHDTYVSREAVGTLKEAWLQAFRITDSIAVKRDKWVQFKRDTCQGDVDDAAMLPSHYDHLLAALLVEEERRTPSVVLSQAAKMPQANGQVR